MWNGEDQRVVDGRVYDMGGRLMEHGTEQSMRVACAECEEAREKWVVPLHALRVLSSLGRCHQSNIAKQLIFQR